MTRTALIAAGVVALTGAAWQISPAWTSGGQSKTRPAAPASAPDERQKQLLRENLDRPADPLLAERFAAINAKYFSGSIAAIPVAWEPRLADVGTLAGRTFTLLGMFGQSGDRSIILLHPNLKDDAAALDRALCHEMVHAYLFALGDTDTNHGDAFKAVLHRLLKEGAFIRIEASPEERAQLHAWLGAESARLEGERAEMNRLAPELESDRLALQHDADDLNRRVAAANAARRGWPTQEELASLNSRRDSYNDRVAALTRRSLDFRIAQDDYNRQVDRYNLMATYPDGLDEPPVPPAIVIRR